MAEKIEKLPAIQWYPGDWRKDPGVQALNYHDRGVWFEIIMLMHESDRRGVLLLNGKAMPDEALAHILGLDNQILTSTLTTILDYGVADRDGDGSLVCRRMVKDEHIRQVRKKAGAKGGNPILLNQIPTPSSSSSSSSSSSDEIVKSARADGPPVVPKGVNGKTPRGVSPKGDEDPGFAGFWKEYPRGERKQGKAKCLRHWKRAGLEPIAEQVIESLQRCKASYDWTKNGGEFIPLPLTWLNRAPWETDPADLVPDHTTSDADALDPADARMIEEMFGGRK
jgi:hypothetical protein